MSPSKSVPAEAAPSIVPRPVSREDCADVLLAVEGLRTVFATPDGGEVEVLRGVDFDVRRGEIVGLVGESGSGKTLSALAILGLLPPGARVAGGKVELAGAGNLLDLRLSARRALRGTRVAMAFQEPASALNPVLTLGYQLTEVLRVHRRVGRRAARQAAVEMLERVAMPDPESRLRSYPHELSGGQQQRAALALALAGGPDLLLADEPTTALDVTLQGQILELLNDLRRDLDLAVLLITHDLGVVAASCDRVAVMYAGRVVETAPVDAFFRSPAHPYSRALLAALPRLGAPGELAVIPGRVPDFGALPSGCAFHSRCSAARAECSEAAPPEVLMDEEHRVACVLYEKDRGEKDRGAKPLPEKRG